MLTQTRTVFSFQFQEYIKLCEGIRSCSCVDSILAVQTCILANVSSASHLQLSIPFLGHLLKFKTDSPLIQSEQWDTCFVSEERAGNYIHFKSSYFGLMLHSFLQSEQRLSSGVPTLVTIIPDACQASIHIIKPLSWQWYYVPWTHLWQYVRSSVKSALLVYRIN